MIGTLTRALDNNLLVQVIPFKILMLITSVYSASLGDDTTCCDDVFTSFPFVDIFMDDSDMDISLDSIVYDTVDYFKYDIAVEANFVDSEADNSMKAIYSGYTDSSGISGCADPHAKFGPDPCNNFREVPFTLHECAGHNNIYLPVTINEITVNALLDTGSQAIVINDK